jgi:chromosome segregation ATPase
MDVQKLAKVLALAASDNDAEALHALRTAKRLLEGYGADFVELSRRIAEGGPGRGGETDSLHDAIFDMRNEIRHLRAENERFRHGRAAAAEPAAPASFQDAAKEAAAAIRLRAELARLSDELEGTRTEMLRLQAHEAIMRDQFGAAMAEAGQLGVKLSEAETRRMRLEAENRRLTHANHALKVELEEAQTSRPVIPQPAEPLAAKPAKRGRAGKGKAASQYALL